MAYLIQRTSYFVFYEEVEVWILARASITLACMMGYVALPSVS